MPRSMAKTSFQLPLVCNASTNTDSNPRTQTTPSSPNYIDPLIASPPFRPGGYGYLILFFGQIIGQIICFTAIIVAKPSCTKRNQMGTLLINALVFSWLGTVILAMCDSVFLFYKYAIVVSCRLPEGHPHAFLRRMTINVANGMAWGCFILQFMALLPIFVVLVWILA